MGIAAAPGWFAGNVWIVAGVTLVLLAIVVIRFVQQTAVRVVLLALIVGVGVFVYVNRVPLEKCARTCECSVAGQPLTVPACDPDSGR